MNILNAYAGIGGNRKLWGNAHTITAVEKDPEIAAAYKKLYPQDTVVVGDALEYIQQHYHRFDFIWASPPCPTHGQYRHNVGVIGKGYDPLIPDMTSLYGLIVFLQHYYDGEWSVENVKPYYAPPIPPRFEMHRHLFWGTFDVPPKDFEHAKIRSKNKISDFEDSHAVLGTNINNKRQVLRNCVDPALGAHILSCVPTPTYGLDLDNI